MSIFRLSGEKRPASRMDRGAWRATVRGVADEHFHFCFTFCQSHQRLSGSVPTLGVQTPVHPPAANHQGGSLNCDKIDRG